MHRRRIAALVTWALLAAACGHTVIVVPAAPRPAAEKHALRQEVRREQGPGTKAVVSTGGGSSVNVAAPIQGQAGSGAASAASPDSRCATTSNPSQGYTANTLTIGTIIPLTGALRPLGEQTLAAMRVSIDRSLNNSTHIPGPYSTINWGCPTRAGVFGRRVSLKVYSLQGNTPEDALAGMRRLIDDDHVFLVRDCYLESNLMGPAVAYENSKGVPGAYCYYSDHIPELDSWNFAPATNPLVSAAIHTAYLIRVMHLTHLAILSDPSQEHLSVVVIRRVAAYLGHPIPDGCVVYKHAQDAPNGEDAEVAALRSCYGPVSPDAVVTSDALNLTFGALAASNQGWQTHWDSGPGSAWVTSLAQVCGAACAGATTDCQALPCIPWASPLKYPSVRRLQTTYRSYLRSYPPDILTYGPQAISDGLGLWLGQTGPNLTREGFRRTLLSLKHWDAGIGPVITITPHDHFGAAAVWMIHFTGHESGPVPWFDDTSGRFVTLSELGVPLSLTRV